MTALLVTYDIADSRRLQRIARLMARYGIRVQKSVFECNLTPARLNELRRNIDQTLVRDEDQIRFYRVPDQVIRNQEVVGRSGERMPESLVVA